MDRTRVVGVTYEGRQNIIKDINEMVDYLVAQREPDNPYDENAIAIYVIKYNGQKKSIGYINRGLAEQLSPRIDAGEELIIHDYFLTGAATQGMNMGVIFEYSLEERSKIAK